MCYNGYVIGIKLFRTGRIKDGGCSYKNTGSRVACERRRISGCRLSPPRGTVLLKIRYATDATTVRRDRKQIFKEEVCYACPGRCRWHPILLVCARNRGPWARLKAHQKDGQISLAVETYNLQRTRRIKPEPEISGSGF